MKTWLTMAALSAAVAAVELSGNLTLAQDAPPATQPAARAGDAKAQADVPVKAVVLFSSGVGYFEHFGAVKGDGSAELRFKTNQINDILKSLVLQDLDGGRINAIQYPSQDPIAKTLRSFQVDITNNPPLAELLNQLRGATVTITAMGDRFEGVVLGAEKRQIIVQPQTPPVESWRVNLLSGATIRQIELDKIADVKLQDPKLQDELTRALSALSQARDQDKKPVTINFTGEGERRVRLGYVVETPIWKTSYRLILGGAPVVKAGEDVKAAAPVNKLQGWAIVENQTDNDWTNVQLSLISGRPISFVQDLYQPLYIPRPVVQPELYASLRPQTYEGGMGKDDRDKVADFNMEAEKSVLGVTAPAASPRRPQQMARQLQRNGGGGGGGAGGELFASDALKEIAEPMDASASVQSVASAAKVGELFQYTVGNVSLPRQKSAMIPIITDDIEVEKLSIYNQSVLAKNPLNGARVKNTTGKHLLQGPITVLDANTYAGDARIDNLPPGQERLLSYGIDLQMLVDATDQKNNQSLLTGKLVKGVLYLTHKNVNEQTYVTQNKGDAEKTLIIEHPRMGGWKLIEGDNKPIETTDALYRFKGKVAAGQSSKLAVRQEFITDQAVAILNADVSVLVYYTQQNEIPKKVRDALAGVIEKKNALTDIERQIAQKNQRLSQFPGEQQRIRENIKIFDANSESRRRLQAKLDKQETEIEDLQNQVQELQKQRNAKQEEFEKSLEGLNVE